MPTAGTGNIPAGNVPTAFETSCIRARPDHFFKFFSTANGESGFSCFNASIAEESGHTS
jgi:hypothetical protein